MALVTYLLGSCVGGPAILVDFDSSSLPAVNGNYYLTFTGGTTPGCYDIIDNAEPSTGIDKVLTMSIDYGDCITCLAVVTPTPTPTNTETPTNTPTPSVTPTQTQTGTANVTPTPTNTETPTNTPTQTNTPSNTATQTSTPTNTPTISVTPSNTPNVCKTYELNGGTDGTTFVGKNCDGFTFNIPVPPYSTTIVCAKEVFVIQGNGYYISIGSCPLPTPTPSVNRDLNITGNGTYVINDGYFVCSNVARLVSCDRNNIFYVNLPIIYSGSPINVGEVINVVIDAETYCVTFVESIIGSSSHYITTINSVHVNCEDCEP